MVLCSASIWCFQNFVIISNVHGNASCLPKTGMFGKRCRFQTKNHCSKPAQP